MRKILLKCSYALGDIVVLTGAVRDLHRAYPGEFQVRVRTSCQPLWWHNPFVRPSDGVDTGAEVLEYACPLITAANRLPAHFLHGCTDFLSAQLGLPLAPFAFHGDIHLSAAEKDAPSPITAFTGKPVPYWLVLAGGKNDLTIKWWSHERYQAVVDYFRDRILFVQLGSLGDHHPRLRHALDLRGRTSLRDLVMWVHHAQGVLCGVTGLMHLAAAVPRPRPEEGIRPCVVIAGGREPPHWEAYPGHQFLHSVGNLSCCKDGGCWRARTKPLWDGSVFDKPPHLCVDVVGNLPRCMDQITANDVIRRLENFVSDSPRRALSRAGARLSRRAIKHCEDHEFDALQTAWKGAAARAERFLRTIPAYPKGRFSQRGVVMCAGGVDYFANAWASLHILRESGCSLPIELWHVGEAELDQRQRCLLEPLQVRCMDTLERKITQKFFGSYPFAVKPFALLHSSFREVLLLDADNLVMRNPEYLFDDEGYRQTGALFWPDRFRLPPDSSIWRLCGVPYRDEPEFESGQMVLDKRRCWVPLNLTWHYNHQASLYYRCIYGDKDTFHMAFRRTGRPYAMPQSPLLSVDGVMVQHDPEGKKLFEHMSCRKLRFFQANASIDGLKMRERALFHLRQLQDLWDGRIGPPNQGIVRAGPRSLSAPRKEAK